MADPAAVAALMAGLSALGMADAGSPLPAQAAAVALAVLAAAVTVIQVGVAW